MKTRKISSVLLAVVMLLSCFTAALPAFAADDVSAVKEQIESFSGDMTTADPDSETLAAYNDMIAAFNALSEDERNSFDVYTFDKLLLAVYDREMTLWKIENNSTSAANAGKASHNRAKAIIIMPAYVDEAITLYTAANAISSEQKADAFIETLKTASKNAIILAGGYYNSYKNFRYGISDKYGAKLIDLAADKISAITMAADAANTPVKPDYVAKPNASKYDGGESNSEYIAAYKAYLKYKEDYAQYNIDRYAFEGENHYFSALKKITDAAPDFQYLYNLSVASLEARRSYNANGDTDKIADATAIYNTLSDCEKASVESLDNIVYSERNIAAQTDLGIDYGYTNYKIPELVDFCKNMEFYHTVKDFEDAVASADLPYTNQDIKNVKAAYNLIPKALQSLISQETLTKYKEILAAVGPDDASDESPDLSSYQSTDVSYHGLCKKDAEYLADSTVDLVLKAAGISDAEEFVNTKILTNEMVVTLSGWLYPLLKEKTSGLISGTPASISKLLSEEKFAGAASALAQAGEDWDAVTVASGDFGFEDGDEEGFLDAICAMLRGAALVHVAVQFENIATTSNGEYTYGAYEELIEIFEILDLNKVMSSVEYTNYIKTAKGTTDSKFRAIFAPIVDLIVSFREDPENTICDILPKLAYAIDSGIVNKRVNNIISMVTFVTIPNIDLTTAGIYKLLNEKVLEPKGISISEDDFCTLIKNLSGCGTAVVKDSVQRGQKYRLGIESDKSKVMVTLLNWVTDRSADNPDFVDSIVDKIGSGSSFSNKVLRFMLKSSAKYLPKWYIFLTVKILIRMVNIYSFLNETITC